MKPLSPKSKEVLKVALANPRWGRLRIAAATGQSTSMVAYRLRMLRKRGLVTASRPRNQHGDEAKYRASRRPHFAFLRVIKGMRWKVQEWKDRLGTKGRFPETWADIDVALLHLKRIEDQMEIISKELN